MGSKAVVILSGGLDSTTCAAVAARDNDQIMCLTFDYGQRHRRELESAKDVAHHFGADHLVVHFDARQRGCSALTDDIDVPKGRGVAGSTHVATGPGTT